MNFRDLLDKTKKEIDRLIELMEKCFKDINKKSIIELCALDSRLLGIHFMLDQMNDHTAVLHQEYQFNHEFRELRDYIYDKRKKYIKITLESY